MMRARTYMLVAGTLAISLFLFWSCGGGGGGGGQGKNMGPIPCGGSFAGTFTEPAGAPPDLTDPRATRHLQITGLSPNPGPIIIDLVCTSGNADLHLAIPGTPLGDTSSANYYFSSSDPGATDQFTITSLGVTNLAKTQDTTYTLADFQAASVPPVFVIASASGPVSYSIQVTCLPAPAATTPIACWGQTTGTVPGSFRLILPDFTDLAETAFHELPPLGATAEEVIIDLSITSGDAHLSLAAPGTVPGSLNPADYVFCSCQPGDDRLILDLGGITEIGGGTAAGLTLADYLATPWPISFLVMGYETSTTYDLGVTCFDPASPPAPATTVPIGCGIQASQTVPGSLSSTLPIFVDLAETIFYEISAVGPTATEVVIDLSITAGDAHLFLAAPGATPGSLNRADYIFSSTETGDDRITLDASGLTDIVGGTLTSVTLGDYLGAATPISFLVTGYDPSTDFDVTVTCCDPASPLIRDAACGTTITGITIEGIAMGPANLANCRQNHFYRITNVPPGAEHVTVLSSTTTTGGDTNVHFLDVGIQPGSTTIADYVFDSVPGLPFRTTQEDAITVMPAGIATWFRSRNTPTLPQYLSSGVDMGFVVTGRASQSTYSLTMFCDTAPIQTPVLIPCGGSDSGSLTGKFLSPPDYTDPNEVTFYEIDGSTLPPGTTSVDIAVTTIAGDCDLYLAAPGITPGIPAMIIESVQAATDTDGLTIDAAGIAGYPGPQGRSTTYWNLTDYLNAPTNISFVVQSWELQSDYSLAVTCN